MDIPKIIFLGFNDIDYSRSGTFVNPNHLDSYESLFLQVGYSLKEILQISLNIRKDLSMSKAIIVILSPSQKLVPFIRIIAKKQVFFDAGWTLTEASVHRKSSLKILTKNYLLDFLAMHLAKITFLESDSQILWVRKIFKVKSKKLRKIYTGFNDELYEKMSKSLLSQYTHEIRRRKKNLTVLYRGKWNAESGLDLLAEVSHNPELSSVLFVIVTDRIPAMTTFGSNVLVIDRYITHEELHSIYLMSDVTLGQLTNHPRLSNTIPHKAFEAGFYGKTYISQSASGVRELYPEDYQVIYMAKGTPKLLTEILIDLARLPNKMRMYETQIKLRYEKVASQEVLRSQFISQILAAIDCK